MGVRFEGKVALVTGGNSGIGRSAALQLAAEGAKTVVAARRASEGEETVRMIEKAGGEAIFVQTDVSVAAQVEALVEQTAKAYGRLDCAFNNAGIRSSAPDVTAIGCDEEEWDHILDVNLKGTWLCMKHQIPLMQKNGGGSIVNMSSVFGLKGSATGGAYAASKHAVIGLTKCIALQFAKENIRANSICPGFIDTPFLTTALPSPEAMARAAGMHALGRMGTSEEVAEAVLWLLSEGASFVTGHTMLVDGGLLL